MCFEILAVDEVPVVIRCLVTVEHLKEHHEASPLPQAPSLVGSLLPFAGIQEIPVLSWMVGV